jgi:phenylacetate-coenzyme A ligase PaaK-like adenylate-forming protein
MDYDIQLSREDNYNKLQLLIEIKDDLNKEELNRLKRKICAKLNVISSLNELINKNKLKLEIKVSSNIKDISDGRAKRQIIDKR